MVPGPLAQVPQAGDPVDGSGPRSAEQFCPESLGGVLAPKFGQVDPGIGEFRRRPGAREGVGPARPEARGNVTHGPAVGPALGLAGALRPARGAARLRLAPALAPAPGRRAGPPLAARLGRPHHPCSTPGTRETGRPKELGLCLTVPSGFSIRLLVTPLDLHAVDVHRVSSGPEALALLLTPFRRPYVFPMYQHAINTDALP